MIIHFNYDKLIDMKKMKPITRMEKYAEYREEILAFDFPNQEVKVKKVHKKENNSRKSLPVNSTFYTYLKNKRAKNIIYSLLGIILIGALIGLLLYLGYNYLWNK